LICGICTVYFEHVVLIQPKSGRKPGRPPKKPKIEAASTLRVDENITIPATFDESTEVSLGSLSTPPSPRSEVR